MTGSPRLAWLFVLVAAVAPAGYAQGCANCSPLSFPDTTVNANVVPNSNTGLTPASSGVAKFATTISAAGAPLPASLPAGTYQAWCGSSPTDGMTPGAFTATSHPGIPSMAWNEINYILNHKQGIVDDVQEAIWAVVGTVPAATLAAQGQTTALAIYNDAIANGQGFTPAPGQKLAAMLAAPAGSGIQDLLVELVNCGSVAGLVWQDTNSNGLPDAGEPGLNNVQVKLLDANGNLVAATLTAPSPVSYPYRTAGSNGWYQFAGISCTAGYTAAVDGTQAAVRGMTGTTTLSAAAAPSVNTATNFGFAGTAAVAIACPLNLAFAGLFYTNNYTPCKYGISSSTPCYSSIHLPVTGGTPPYTYSASGLPPGVSLNGTTGVVYGVPTAAGSYAPQFTVTDSMGATATGACPATVMPQPVSAACPTMSGTAGTPFSARYAPMGGNGQYTYQLSGGLALGLTLNADGSITGTPTGPGLFYPLVVIRDTGGSTNSVYTYVSQCPLTVAPAPASISCPAPAANLGGPYASAVAGTGGTPPYTFQVSGSMPPGLSATASATAVQISGTPGQLGTYTFTASLTDATAGTPFTASTSPACTITVGQRYTIGCPAAKTGTAQAPYNSAVTVSGSSGPFSFALAGGGLPPGVNLSSGGQVSGTPATAGAYNFAVQVSDYSTGTNTPTVETSGTCAIAIGLTASCPSVRSGMAGQPFRAAMTGVGAPAGATYTFTNALNLPPGLTMDNTGTISGTPTAPGTYTFTAAVADSAGDSGTATCTITIYPALAAACPPAATAQQGTAMTPSPAAASGGAGGPYTFAASGLPAGLTMSAAGVLAGAPSVSGTFSYTMTVTDQAGNTTMVSCTIAVAAPAITLPPVTDACPAVAAVQGTPMTPTAVDAAGGAGGPYTFSAVGLPAGVTLSSAGVLAGTPAAAGMFPYTMTIRDVSGNSGVSSCSMTVAPPPYAGTLGPLTYNVSESGGSVAGEVVWFNSHLTKLGGTIPASDFQIFVQNGTITFGTVTLAVPSAIITFSSQATCAATSFDSASNTWRTTVPLAYAAKADEIFLAGLAYPLPAGFAQNVNQVTWTATVSSPAQGLQVTWQYGVSNWRMQNNGAAFPMAGGAPDYNGLLLNPAHNAPACAYSGGDHAGAPEFTGRTVLLTAGGSGGGGSNWTGSWSATPAAITISGPAVGAGDAATIGFWHNKNGQSVIASMNGGAPALGNWLAAQFPHLYGAASGNSLAGATNAQVATYYLSLFDHDKTGAQIMAVALAVYVTSPALSGTTAPGYGLQSSPGGVGVKLWTPGANGPGMGLLNGPAYSVLMLLAQADALAANGTYAVAAGALNAVFGGINQAGGI